MPAALQGRPEPLTRARSVRGSSLASPTVVGRLLQVTRRGPASWDPLELWHRRPGEGGRERATLQSAARARAAAVPAPASLPPAGLEISAPSAAERSAANPQDARVPHFGASRSPSRIPPLGPSPPSERSWRRLPRGADPPSFLPSSRHRLR